MLGCDDFDFKVERLWRIICHGGLKKRQGSCQQVRTPASPSGSKPLRSTGSVGPRPASARSNVCFWNLSAMVHPLVTRRQKTPHSRAANWRFVELPRQLLEQPLKCSDMFRAKHTVTRHVFLRNLARYEFRLGCPIGQQPKPAMRHVTFKGRAATVPGALTAADLICRDEHFLPNRSHGLIAP